jgi:hypothetical protein
MTFFVGSVTGKSQLRFEDDFDYNKIKVIKSVLFFTVFVYVKFLQSGFCSNLHCLHNNNDCNNHHHHYYNHRHQNM